MFEALVTLGVVGATQLYNQIRNKDYIGALTIVVAAVLGVLCGVFHQFGFDWFTGLTAGLAAVGVHTVAKQV